MRGACEEAYPAASAAYLQRLSRCYGKAMRDYGDTAPDSGAIIDECSQKILMGAEVGNVSGTDLYKARCARQARCQNVSQEVCDGAWARLDGMTQSLLSSKYNLRAQAEIAACLEREGLPGRRRVGGARLLQGHAQEDRVAPALARP